MSELSTPHAPETARFRVPAALWWLSGLAVVAALNLFMWTTSTQDVPPPEGLWVAMETVTLPDRPDVPPVFPDAIRAEEGRRVTLSGVAFVTEAGVVDGTVRWFVLMPQSRYGCCGVTCDPRPEMSVYVDCSEQPWIAGGETQLLVTVEGTLRLERDGGSWCLYGLDGATVTPVTP